MGLLEEPQEAMLRWNGVCDGGGLVVSFEAEMWKARTFQRNQVLGLFRDVAKD
jgi:hypothetical protein